MTTTWRPVRLGQVPILGPSAPFTGYSPAGYFANPSGTPLMSEELTSPEHTASEFHCYKSPDGKYVSIPFGQADAYKAAGYEAVDYSNCGSPPLHAQPVGTPSFVMGQANPISSGVMIGGIVVVGLSLAGLWYLLATRKKGRRK
jgi:hypothetical protein